MAQSNISTWLQFALQQMAAESYLDQLATGRLLRDILADGNNDTRIVQPDPFTGEFPGKTRFATVQAQQFTQRYQIVDHHANDESGFSATLLFDTQTQTYTLSFRSTEYQNPAQGGDFLRDGTTFLPFVQGADAEIVTSGFAFGQLAAMEQYWGDLTQGRVKKWGQTRFMTGFLGRPLGRGRTRRFSRAATASLNRSLPKAQALLVASRISARWESSK